ncbi:MAG: class I SAM-dependent methyltransferase [Myxococcota bacterium]|nr:class I SAM-dependent methyltransferase [Myxococcota bacterium]
MQLRALAQAALERRADLIASLPQTDCYRLLHGAVEGWPGLTVDRYGPLLVVQTFRAPLSDKARAALLSVYADLGLLPVFRHRGREAAEVPVPSPEALADHVGMERSLSYRVRAVHRGQDPLLFLDFRAGRRWIAANSTGCSVLNLFAYTCGIGVAAAAGGASEVLNVDFAASALAVGRENAALNGVSMAFLQSDAIPALRQLAGLTIRGRAARRKYPRLKARQFDRVVLDPPTFARSPFGAVDLVRDYPALFKPAVLSCASGGMVLATNHVSAVSLPDWLDVLTRCAEKAGRPLKRLAVLEPEGDFPPLNGGHLLKMAVCEV